jgi:hypothetical protein
MALSEPVVLRSLQGLTKPHPATWAILAPGARPHYKAHYLRYENFRVVRTLGGRAGDVMVRTQGWWGNSPPVLMGLISFGETTPWH